MAKITSSDALDLITLSKAENKLGDIKQSMLTLAQFSAEHLGTWQLMDGGSCVGTAYQSLTGNAVVPDMRSSVARMKDHGKGRNPDGDLALGTYQADAFGSHQHDAAYVFAQASLVTFDGTSFNAGGNARYLNRTTSPTAAQGSNETRMKSVTVNFFIKVGY